MAEKQKIVVGITGASGSIYAQRLLYHLAQCTPQLETGIVCSSNAATVWEQELGTPMDFPFRVYDRRDFFAPFASGSAQYRHMVIAPCSMGTLARIAHGVSDDLITRTADVMLKERRQLICIVREAPYSLIHLRNMTALTEAGAIIVPASPSFYGRPDSIPALVDTVVMRVLDLMGIDRGGYRWGQEQAPD